MQGTPLTYAQIDAACCLHSTIVEWQTTDRALNRLRESMPDWSKEECVTKCIMINSLYSTNVMAILRMASHVHNVFQQQPRVSDDLLVERISQVKPLRGQKLRNHTSFASKLCHVFIDADRFPIYDSVAREMLKLHLGGAYIECTKAPYKGFRKNLCQLTEMPQITANGRDLDRYLWLAGIYSRYLRKRSANSEFREMLKRPTARQRVCLRELLPMALKRKIMS